MYLIHIKYIFQEQNMNRMNKLVQIYFSFILLFVNNLLYSQTPTANFATWKDNKTATYTIIHDDYSNYVTGIYDHADPIATAKGIKICFGAITNYCGATEWTKARTMISHGHECINHTHNHKCGGTAGQCSGFLRYNSTDFATELDLSTQLIETNTGIRPRFFIHPYDAGSNAIVTHLASLGYLGARGGTQELVNTSSFTDFFHLNYHVFRPESDISTLNQAVDAAIAAGGYAVREFHGIDDNSYGVLTKDQYTEHLNYVQSKIGDGSLWSATASEAITYKMQRDVYVPNIVYTSSSEKIDVSFTANTTINDKILTTPVTLNINLTGQIGGYYITQNNIIIPHSQVGNRLSVNIYPHKGPITAQRSTTISVDLTMIAANINLMKKQVEVTWETATEQQSDFFVIERKAELKDQFQEIGRIKGAGNSAKALIYNWIDKNPFEGISYYRLRQVDSDGKITYSKIVSVEYNDASKIKIFPTFTEGGVFIESNGKPIDEVLILNNFGQLVLRSKQNQLDLSAFANGLYIIKIKIGSEQFVEKVTKR